MAKFVQALARYRPRIVHQGQIGTRQVIRDLADVSSLSKGDAASFLQDLGDIVLRYLRVGHSVKVEGIGCFQLGLGLDGEVRLNITEDRELTGELNMDQGFEGEIKHKDLLGSDREKIIELWNAEFPDDPIED